MKTVMGGMVVALTLASPALAAPQVTVTDAWIRALPGQLPAGGYFTLHNGTAKKLTMSGAASPACGMLMLHKSDTMNGMASMSDVATIDVPAGGTLRFSPGGLHLMCMEPKPEIKRGAEVIVTLQFTGGNNLPVRFSVRGANGK
jgi:copper(I)-binding protein